MNYSDKYMANNQREGSISNAHAGREFEITAMNYFKKNKIILNSGFSIDIGISQKKKPHKFDLGSKNPKIIIECKSHTWTAEGNVPSAKLTVWNEAMYYFSLVSNDYKKIIFVQKSFNEKKNETLAEYYIRTYDHLIPNGVEIIEFDVDSKKGKKIL